MFSILLVLLRLTRLGVFLWIFVLPKAFSVVEVGNAGSGLVRDLGEVVDLVDEVLEEGLICLELTQRRLRRALVSKLPPISLEAEDQLWPRRGLLRVTRPLFGQIQSQSMGHLNLLHIHCQRIV